MRFGHTARLASSTLAVVLVGLIVSSCSQAASVKPPKKTLETVAAHPSPGCSAGSHPELTLVKQTISVNGTPRWYLISTPPDQRSSDPAALVLDFHGLDEGAALEATTSQFGPFGQAHGFIAAFPEGTGNPLSWDTATTAPSNPDLQFVSDLLDNIEATQCVDETRIYATGLSDGAFMTSLLACTMSDRIAAFAPVSGVQLPHPCAATRRVPILAFHGTGDPILYFNGGLGTSVLEHAIGEEKGTAPKVAIPKANLNGPGYPATVKAWAERDGCSADPVNTKIASQVIRRVYKCPVGTAVEFYIILGGGHAWPGSKFSEEIASVTGPTTFEINATSIIWNFFEQFRT
jgi:polyhydroxybutyrate depolymerase